MAELDFLSNVETAFLKLFAADDVLRNYNWEKWDSDKEMKIPRGHIGFRARRDPEETPYHRIDVTVTFEGRPKKTKLSVVMAALKTLLETKSTSDLDTASGDRVKFIGGAISVNEERRIMGGLRTWLFTFAIYAVPMPAA